MDGDRGNFGADTTTFLVRLSGSLGLIKIEVLANHIAQMGDISWLVSSRTLLYQGKSCKIV